MKTVLVALALLLMTQIALAQGKGRKTVLIDSVPAGAEVMQGATRLGTTPLTLSYPITYFRPAEGVAARHLSDPLELEFKLDGYQDAVVKLGSGPYTWRNSYGIPFYDFWLLEFDYKIPLRPAASSPAAIPGLSYIDELERLAKLRGAGVLTEEEFQLKKREALSRPSELAPTVEEEPLPTHTEPSVCPAAVAVEIPRATRDLPSATPTALDFARRKGRETSEFYASLVLASDACQRARFTRIRFSHTGKKKVALEIAVLVRLGRYMQKLDVTLEALAGGQVVTSKEWKKRGILSSNDAVAASEPKRHFYDVWLRLKYEVPRAEFLAWWDASEPPSVRLALTEKR